MLIRLYLVSLVLLFFGSMLYAQEYVIFEQDVFSNKLQSLVEDGHIEEALQLCHDVLSKGTTLTDRAHTYYYLSAFYLLQGANEEAISFADQSLAAFQQIKHYEGQIKTLTLVGKIKMESATAEEAKAPLEQAAKLVSKNTRTAIVIDLLQSRAIMLSRTGAHKAAMSALKEALGISQKNNDLESKLFILNQISTNYYAIGEIDSAIYFFEILLAQKKGLEQNTINDLNTLGALYAEIGDYAAAQSYLIQALRLAETQQDTFFMMSLRTHISQLYAAQNQWEKTISYATTAMEMAEAKKIELTAAQNHQTLASAHQAMNNIPAAIIHSERALTYYRKLDNRIQLANTQFQLANLYQNTDNIRQAYVNTQAALALRESASDVLGILEATLLSAKLEIILGYHAKAVQSSEKLIALAKKMNNFEAIQQGYLQQATALEKLGRYRDALTAYKFFDVLSDSLNNNDQLKIINDLELSYETEKKDKAILAQKATLEQQANQVQSQKTQILLLLLLLGILSIIAVAGYFVYQKNRQLDMQKIEVLNKEQETRILKAVLEAEDYERARIAKDLHDGLGTLLATVKLSVDAINPNKSAALNQIHFEKSKDLIDRACASVREISHNMMPHFLEQQGLENAINDLADTIKKTHPIDISVIYLSEKEITLPPKLQLTVYRIVQELLRNVLKHASATETIVQISVNEESLVLVVEDDGQGFQTEPNSFVRGIGLENIRSRVKYLEGDMQVESALGTGTTIFIDFPIKTA
jgi:two-component system, NarL family, sensor kinase